MTEPQPSEGLPLAVIEAVVSRAEAAIANEQKLRLAGEAMWRARTHAMTCDFLDSAVGCTCGAVEDQKVAMTEWRRVVNQIDEGRRKGD